MQPERTVLRNIGENLRRVRTEAGCSQSALASRSGVSRRTIINLEAGDANVSLSSIDRLAHALGSTFATLVASPARPLSDIDELAWRGSSPISAATLLGIVPAHAEAQLWTWTLAAGERYDAEADPDGWHEMIAVTAGRLRIEKDDGDVELEPGGHVIFPTNQGYAYVAGEGSPATFIRIVAS